MSIHKLIAYTFAFASAILACTYGILSATGFYAYAKAFVLCLVAFGGCHGPTYIRKTAQSRNWLGVCLAVPATAFCLLVTLWGGLGTISSGGAELRAERNKVVSDAARDREALRRLRGERDALGTPRPAAAVSADISAAKAAAAYKASNGCDPEQITASRTREYCGAFRKLEAELATATEAARLDAEAAAAERRLSHAPPEMEADPQAAAFSRLTGVAVELSAALYALAASIALELVGMVAMMVAWDERQQFVREPNAMGRDGAGSKRAGESLVSIGNTSKRAPAPVDPRRKEIAPIQQTNVVSMPRQQVFGSVKKFVLACVAPADAERVQLSAIFMRYQEWCDAGGVPAASLDRFLDEIEAICKRTGLRVEPVDGHVCALDVKLTA